MHRFFLLLITIITLAGCAAQGELTSPCACAEIPINSTDELPA